MRQMEKGKRKMFRICIDDWRKQTKKPHKMERISNINAVFEALKKRSEIAAYWSWEEVHVRKWKRKGEREIVKSSIDLIWFHRNVTLKIHSKIDLCKFLHFLPACKQY